MTTIDKEKLEVHVSDTLTFEADVLPVVADIYYTIQEDLQKVERDSDKDNINRFLEYELTHEDKIKILELVVEDYEFEYGRTDSEVSIFDYDGIRRSLEHWIEEKFGFTIY